MCWESELSFFFFFPLQIMTRHPLVEKFKLKCVPYQVSMKIGIFISKVLPTEHKPTPRSPQYLCTGGFETPRHTACVKQHKELFQAPISRSKKSH